MSLLTQLNIQNAPTDATHVVRKTDFDAQRTQFYANLAAFPATGAAGKEYVAIDTGIQYQWKSGAYVALGAPAQQWTPRGAWSNATNYAEFDVVTSAGSSFIALDANINSLPPSSHWALVAQSGSNLVGTSVSSVVIGSGSKSFTTQAGLGWSVGQWLIALADSTHYVVGQVASYSGTSLVLTVAGSDIFGAGTYSSWTINVSGRRGLAGSGGGTGAVGAGYDGHSTTSLSIGTGSKVLTLDGASATYAYATGQRLRFISTASPSNWMEGPCVRSALDLTMTVSAGNTSGSGTFADWQVAVAGEKGSDGGAGIRHASAVLAGYTDLGSAEVPATHPPDLIVTLTASAPQAELTFNFNGTGRVVTIGGTSPGGVWVDTSTFTTPEECATALCNYWNSLSIPGLAATVSASEVTFSNEGSGTSSNNSLGISGVGVSQSGGGTGGDFAAAQAPTGGPVQVELLPAATGKKCRTIRATITGTLLEGVRLCLKKNGTYTDVAPPVVPAGTSPISYAPTDAATEQLWNLGQDTGESLVAVISDVSVVDSGGAVIQFCGDQG